MSVVLAKTELTENLSDYGLTEADLPAVDTAFEKLNTVSNDSILNFGADVASHASSYVDNFMGTLRSKDLEVAGKKLTQVVRLAGSAKMGMLTNRSTLPVIGPAIDFARRKIARVQEHTESTKTQMARLMDEVGTIQEGLTEQNRALENSFVNVQEEARLLGISLLAGRRKLIELNAEIESLKQQGDNNPAITQALSDKQDKANLLDIRLGNLLALQQSAYQTLPQIRVVQAGNNVLIEKYHTINTVTLPAWKRQFMLRVGLNEQQNAIKVADAIDEATNSLLKENAKLLHRNAVESAKAQQRLVITPDTMREVQNELLATVKEVIAENQKGIAERHRAEAEISQMRQDFNLQLSQAGGHFDNQQKRLTH